MAFKTITENGVTRVGANVELSNGQTLYVELPITHDPEDNSAHEEHIRNYVNSQNTSYDDEGNEITSDVTIVSITETD